MIGNEQRREVAQRLREVETLEYDGDVWCDEGDVLDALGLYNTDDPSSCDPNKVEFLAVLIDRPTCKDAGRGYTFECSECGCRIGVILRDSREGEPAMTVHDDPLYEPHYCPNCGAEVVE